MDKSLREKYEIPIEKLRYECNLEEWTFKTTKELKPENLEAVIIGQEKALKSIKHGLEMHDDKFNNIFAAGPEGTGKNTILRHQIKKYINSKEYRPIAEKTDIISVYNFESPDNPRLLAFKTGQGQRFIEKLDGIIKGITVQGMQEYGKKIEISYMQTTERVENMLAGYDTKKKKLGMKFGNLQKESNELTDQIQEKRTQDSKDPEIKILQDKVKELGQSMLDLQKEVRVLEDDKTEQVSKLQTEESKIQDTIKEEWIKSWIKPKLEQIKKVYSSKTLDAYLDNMGDKLTKEIGVLMNKELTKIAQKMNPTAQFMLSPNLDLSKYQAKVLYDSAKIKEVPVMIEREPTFENLFGKIKNIERRSDNQLDVKDDQHLRLSLEKSGSYMKAHGGYLILDAISVLLNGTWGILQKCILNEEADISHLYFPFFGNPIRSEPIETKVKVILKGPNWLYTLLNHQNSIGLKEILEKDSSTPQRLLDILPNYKGDLEDLVKQVVVSDKPKAEFSGGVYDENFSKLFKVKAQFDTSVKNDTESRNRYAKFIARFCERKELGAMTREGVTEIIEQLAREADSKDKLTLYIGDVENLIRESGKEAFLAGKKEITEEHVKKAIKDKRERHNLIEERIQEMIEEGIIIIDTEKELKGEINALSIYSYPDLRFGFPGKLTMNASKGKEGVISLDVEADKAGGLYEKAVYTLIKYTEKIFAQDKRISLNAGLSMEQTYGGIDGDSATLSSFLALMSELSEFPIDQEIAVTGSMNQKGRVQAIGGVNEKVEGFYRTCKVRGLTGTQGVIIPKSNENDLMLSNELVEAVEKKKFHVYSVSRPEEAIEIIIGQRSCVYDEKDKMVFAPGTVYGKVNNKIIEYNKSPEKEGKE